MTLPTFPGQPGTPARLVHPGAYPRLLKRHTRETGTPARCRRCGFLGSVDICNACTAVVTSPVSVIAWSGYGVGARYQPDAA